MYYEKREKEREREVSEWVSEWVGEVIYFLSFTHTHTQTYIDYFKRERNKKIKKERDYLAWLPLIILTFSFTPSMLQYLHFSLSLSSFFFFFTLRLFFPLILPAALLFSDSTDVILGETVLVLTLFVRLGNIGRGYIVQIGLPLWMLVLLKSYLMLVDGWVCLYINCLGHWLTDWLTDWLWF